MRDVGNSHLCVECSIEEIEERQMEVILREEVIVERLDRKVGYGEERQSDCAPKYARRG